MTTLTLIKFIVGVIVISLGSYALYRENDIAKFERKIGRYIKAFFKALIYTIRDKKNNKKYIEASQYKNEEYDEILKSLNKSAIIEELFVA